MASDIRNLCRECDRLFGQIIAIEISRSFDVITTLREQFEQWTENLGVYANPRLSLDASLAYSESESLRDLVLELLRIIKRNLLRIENQEASHPDDGGGFRDSIISQMGYTAGQKLSSVLVESLQALESALESLLRLGVAIQKSSASTLAQRVSNFMKRKDDGVLEEAIFRQLRQRLVDGPREDKSLGAAFSLCRQLASSVSFRCFRTEYIRRRDAKKRSAVVPEETSSRNVAQDTKPRSDAPPTPTEGGRRESIASPPVKVTVKSGLENPLLKRIRHDVPPTHFQSETTPTMPDARAAEREYAKGGDTFFGTNSVISVRVPSNVRYPKPPRVELTAKSATCSYCCKSFPKSLFDNQAKWEHHVDLDLHLYTCISPECVEPPQLFARFEEWKAHMKSEHSGNWISEVHTPVSWRCEGGDCHEHAFDDETKLEKHIKEKHGEHGQGMEVWKELCEVRIPRPDHTCPICNTIPKRLADIVRPDDQGVPSIAVENNADLREELLRHIAEHLKEIGLLSIHYLYDEDETESFVGSIGENQKGLPEGEWRQGEWVPSIAPYVDRQFLGFSSQGVPKSLLSPIKWCEIVEGFPQLKSDNEHLNLQLHVSDWEGVDFEDLVLDRCVKSRFQKEGTGFMPEGELRHIVTEALVEEMLSEFSEDEDEFQELVAFILTRAVKLFTVTALIMEDQKLYQAMAMFKESHFSDEKLPIKPLKIHDKEHDFTSFGGPWKRREIRDFYDRQWTFLVPVIQAATSERQSDYDFEHRRILPFTERFDEGFDTGSFGQVSKYRIHASHLDDPEEPVDPDLGRDLAVKELRPGSKEERKMMITNWEREAGVLQKMNALRQPNIARFITAFRRGIKGDEDYFLVFEWANGGNLRALWKTLERPWLTPELVQATVKQILGLATALHAVHYPEAGPTFRHGDLKPENILWFRDGNKGISDGNNGGIGTLKIADWGVAKQHNVDTELRSNKTLTEFGTRRYEPPEEHTGQGIGLPASNSNEVGGRQRKRRSRLYDVWAMGCITLEFIVWLVYGREGLQAFNLQIKSEGSDRPPFYQIKVENGWRVAEVHPAAVRWMDHMVNLPACQPGVTALGSLLELVRTRLLVTELPVRLGTLESSIEPQGDSNPSIPQIIISEQVPTHPSRAAKPGGTRGRARSDEFVTRMKEIVYLENKDEQYWLAGTDMPDQFLPPWPASVTQFILPFDTNIREYHTDNSSMNTEPREGLAYKDRRAGGQGLLIDGSRQNEPLTLVAPTQHRVDYGDTMLDSDWTISIDNDLAMDLFTVINTTHSSVLPRAAPASNICKPCQFLRDHVWDVAFDMTYDISHLKGNADAKACDLCSLFWNACHRYELTSFEDAHFKRVGSSIIINNTSSTSLSIFRDIDLKTRIDESIQIGFGILPKANSEAHFEVIRQWLACCDNNKNNKHSSCRQCDSPTSNNFGLSGKKKLLPTRVLEVGQKVHDKVYLRATTPSETGEWLALCCQWGPTPHFYTTIDNLNSHLQGMEFATLPATFRDAVIVTRALGCRYLWIDSLCIVQGEGGDFNQEAKRMEQVYSGAYCVLAISRAASHYGGFLHRRRERDVVALSPSQAHQNRSSKPSTSPPSFYICESIDDFNSHVLESGLNRRGWVFQEHALARRTVFFTDHQTYFECGEGVRCETMMKMYSPQAKLLGDPNFPRIIMESNQGEMTHHYQNLYRRYSRLSLGNDCDRPIAIAGLQDRLLGALQAFGGFGVFDGGAKNMGLLRRGLLWHRAESQTQAMKRIKFPAARHAIPIVPSWSWMAYSGAIDYFTPRFGNVNWEEMESPWYGQHHDGDADRKEDIGSENMSLVAMARDYDMDLIMNSDGYHDGTTTTALMFDRVTHENLFDPGQRTMCVVLGSDKGEPDRALRQHYVLLVEVTGRVRFRNDDVSKVICERVGAGCLAGRFINWARDPVKVEIR